MPSCAFPTCKERAGSKPKSLGTTFHRFPTDEARNLIWTRILQKSRIDPYWKPHCRGSFLCSNHFDEKFFYTTKSGLRRLTKEAIPTKEIAMFIEEDDVLEEAKITMQPSTSKDVGLQLVRSSPTTNSEVRGANIVDFKHISPPKSPAANSEIGDVDIADLDHIFDSPKKAKLRNRLEKIELKFKRQLRCNKNLQRKNKRLIKKNESLKNILNNLKNNRYVSDDVYNLLSNNIIAADLFNNIYKKNKKKQKKIKYSLKMKKFCLTLNFLSPNAYKYVRATFDTCLPHPQTLIKWYSHIDGAPGFTEESFLALKEKAAKAASTGRKLICALMADEMSIRQQSLWDGKKNIGYIDLGSGPSEGCKTLATEAYVFLLNAINDNFKIPLGYFLVHGLNAEQKVNLINLCLTKCHEAGVMVVSLTFDGHATNTNVMNILGCKTDHNAPLKTTFKHPVDKSEVAIFLDPVHMFKLIRNHFENKRVFLDENTKEIKWDYLVQLNNIQEKEGLHIANKLTRRHLQFRNNIMKVKLAAQVFSKSVGDAINFCRVDANLATFKDAKATENFIYSINNLFDIFNSRNLGQFDYKQPLNKNNKEIFFNYLDKMDRYIREIKIKNITQRTVKKDGKKVKVILKNYKYVLDCLCKVGFLGTLININSLKALYLNLVEKNNDLYCLPLYKFSQDHLELLFGTIRMHGGHNDNPNARQFKGIYRKVICNLELKATENGNCIPLENIGFLNCSSSTNCINSSTSAQRQKIDDELFDRFLEKPETVEKDFDSIANLLSNNRPNLGNLTKYIVGYISGNVARSLAKTLKCVFCVESLLSLEVLWFHKLIGLKDRGGLCYPSQSLYDICCTCEDYVRKLSDDDFVIFSNKQRLFMVVTIFKQFLGSNVLEDPNIEHTNRLIHRNSLLRAIIEKYLNIRFHYIAKRKTQKISADSKRQYFRKLTQQKGI